ncbi:MAG: NAD(+) synthase [Thermincola sp.]|jgi:NAD+ synthase (glutamine-hydrolysing)|nr:NAD(+) synthase [Thermincola sp.]MDT3701553.1 NAD(+) synthase [Thermincola sp.]
MTTYGFVKVAAVSPRLKVADPLFNTQETEQLIKAADAAGAAVAVFPELGLTGYTCGDLFGQQLLLDKTIACLGLLLENTEDTDVLAVIGMPLAVNQKLYNCGAAIQHGQVLGIVPKLYPANYKEFYENRWFASGHTISQNMAQVEVLGKQVPFGEILFTCRQFKYCLGIEICEDLWTVVPSSSYMALNGANLTANLSASNDLVSKAGYRRQLVAQQSARCISGYIYASAGVHESTTDLVFGGDCIIAENGSILETSRRFHRDSAVIYSEIDVERLNSERQVNRTFTENYEIEGARKKFIRVEVSYNTIPSVEKAQFGRFVPRHPFIPDDLSSRHERCQEIFNIQVAGLAKRIEHTGMTSAVIGVSGGLDSTLALLVIAKTFKLLELPPQNIIAVTMPGFGTTETTFNNATKLMQSLQVNPHEISIVPACRQHFADIGLPEGVFDVTYENSQARERTQILMDLANKYNGLVVGTGDLSELALGWATYNGDHMSMYAVNCSIPKTLVKFLVQWIADNEVDESTRETLYNILNTPISPELLPPDANGEILQKTEEVVGPYELHDFFLYYAVRHGMAPRKILFLADVAFAGAYERDEIKKWLKTFYRRFFSQQFKRSCLPDGPKVGTISLSPRGDWRMPSDAEARLWLAELD